MKAVIPKTCWLLMLLTGAILLNAQNRKTENALLWKITGSTLSRPSYLFGTIHLRDRRVFNFNDSLYKFLESVDGFAMELHPDSMAMALLRRANKSGEDKLAARLRKPDDSTAHSDTDQIADEASPTKKSKQVRQPVPRADDMETFVDAFLFTIAKHHGKEIIGLENLGEQERVLAQLWDNVDANTVVKGMKPGSDIFEHMTELYVREDLKGILKVLSSMPKGSEEEFFIKRNYAMLGKMEDVITEKSFLFAVGAGHLAGQQGLIALLRQQGYTVEPVYAKGRTHGSKYIEALPKRPTAWVDVNEPAYGYSIRMPGKPTAMDMLHGSMKMNLYLELGTLKQYLAAFVASSVHVTGQNADSMLQKIRGGVVTNSKATPGSSTRFRKDDFEGVDFEYYIESEKTFGRSQVLARGNRTYILTMASRIKKELHEQEAEEFFNSFKTREIITEGWQMHNFSNYHFKVSFPEKPRFQTLALPDESVNGVQFISIDNKTSITYLMTIATANPGFGLKDDSTYFADALLNMQNGMVISNMRLQDTVISGLHAKGMIANTIDNLAIRCLFVKRANRVYNLMSVYPQRDSARADVKAFFQSLSLTDYPPLEWSGRSMPDLGFIAPLTGSVEKMYYLDTLHDQPDSLRELQWLIHDTVSATSFSVVRRKLMPELLGEADTAILDTYLADFITGDERFGPVKEVKNGLRKGMEVDIFRPNTTMVQRVRMIWNNKWMYSLEVSLPATYWDRPDFRKFQEDFRLIE